MTTSVAALAVNQNTNSNYLLSSSHSSPVLPTSAAANNSTSSTSIMDVTDSNYEIKTEFYTREGIWKLVPNCEYAKSHQLQQQQQNYYQQNNQLNNSNSSSNSANLNQLNNSNNGSNLNQCSTSTINNNNAICSNDQVKLGIFKYSYETIYGATCNNNTNQIDSNKLTKLHKECNLKLNLDQNDDDEIVDDDDDVIFTKFNPNNRSFKSNKNNVLNENPNTNKIHSKNNKKESNTSTNSSDLIKSTSSPSLDLILFNFGREMYTYEFNPIKSKSNESRNLIDKKVYKTFMSTCFDINYVASQANTLVYQTKAPQLVTPVTNNNNNNIQTQTAGSSSSNSSSTINTPVTNSQSLPNLNLSSSYLSLIVAAGFNKGEIHVFDVFKKEASVFFNNSKLIDKTKVTCIKWLPNSINLFLASYSSGNIYLFDASNLTQSTVAPVYTKLVQNDSFSIFVNNNVSSSSSSSSASNNSTQSNNVNSTSSELDSLNYSSNLKQQQLKQSSNNNSSNSLNKNSSPTTLNGSSGLNQQLKLVLTNQQSSTSSATSSGQQSNNNVNNQISKNPLLKFSIGNTAAYFANDPSANTYISANQNMGSFGINGVNEFAFSPCGQYLAIVSQDGFLRVFKFIYKSNQQMQIELHCSMKSYFGGLLCLAWSQDGKYIATGGEDDLITLFSFVEMRVVLRGRGHSSWINSVQFDPWTRLDDCDSDGIEIYNSDTDEDSDKNGEDFSSSDEANNLKTIQNNDITALSNLKITAPKKRTISTLSDIKHNLNNSSLNNRASNYYRLASCGQDNQICFWDLTDDVLKEKQPLNTPSIVQINKSPPGINLPQIIIEPNNDSIVSTTSNINTNINLTVSSNSSSGSSGGTTRSFVSTAKNLFGGGSSGSNSKKSSNQNDDLEDTKSTSSGISSGLSTASSFFRRHKRTNTHSSVTSTDTSTKLSSKSNNKELASSTSSKNNNQVTLNSYKKSPNSLFSIGSTSSSSKTVSNDSSDSSQSVSLTKKNSFNTQKNNSSTISNSSLNAAMANLPFNLCPKLDQVPIIEPLICKRISNERLTSIIFKKDCFITANQDGLISTWARPTSNKQLNNKIYESTLNHIVNDQLPQLSTSSLSTENKINFTSL